MKFSHSVFLLLFVAFAAIIFGCKKINLPTELGQDLIPEVDNIHTFDTTLEVVAYNGIFSDTSRSFITNEQFLGVISNDPVFGKTDARMYFELLPQSRVPFNNVPSKRILDSVVLILNYLETYGDTAAIQNLQVSELSQSNNFRNDSAYFISKNDWVTTNILGNKQFAPYTLKDSVKIPTLYKDADSATANQLRIRLSDVFGNRLLSYDTTGANNAYYNDTIFRSFFKGFALQATNGNAVVGFNLLGANTKLAIYYRYENTTTAGDQDTAVAYFTANNTFGTGASANYIARDYSGTQIAATANDNIADNIVYVQNTPGTFAKLVVPGLKTLKQNNRLMTVHLAELNMQSIYHIKDTLFNAPVNMFLDVYDDTASKYKAIPYLFNDYTQSNGNLSNFYTTGSSTHYTFTNDASGNSVKQWRFNLTRYIQNVFKAVTPGATPLPVYDFRLYAPSSITLPYDYYINGNKYSQSIRFPISGTIPVIGRVQLGNGNSSTQKMKLRIVYSKV